MKFGYKNVLIYGYSNSGQVVEKVLKSLGVKYRVFDDFVYYNEIKFLKKLSKKIIKNFDLIVISPAVSIYNKFIQFAIKKGIKVVSELEFGYWFKKDASIIAITGTNGKTTTTGLINNVLKKKYNTEMLGNIGTPLSTIYFNTLKYVSCEVSSFQLEAIDKFKPEISILLNLAPDHLDRHKNFENYIKSKLNIFKNYKRNSLAILNFDDKKVIEVTKDLKCVKYYVSTIERVKGVYVKNNIVYSTLHGKNDKICEIDKLTNNKIFLTDYLCALLVGLLKNVPKNEIIEELSKYKLLAHRCEFVSELHGIKYYDDSKATNIHSVIKCLENFKENVILLLGGKHKGLNYKDLFKQLPKCVKFICAFGESSKIIKKASIKYKYKNCKAFIKLKDAFDYTTDIAVSGDTVLLSPACSSFDEFKSYINRGEYFKNLVMEYVRINEKVME